MLAYRSLLFFITDGVPPQIQGVGFDRVLEWRLERLLGWPPLEALEEMVEREMRERARRREAEEGPEEKDWEVEAEVYFVKLVYEMPRYNNRKYPL